MQHTKRTSRVRAQAQDHRPRDQARAKQFLRDRIHRKQSTHAHKQTNRNKTHCPNFEERLLTALEVVSRRSSSPPEDSDPLFSKSFLKHFKTLSFRTRWDLKFQILVYKAKCLEAGHTDSSEHCFIFC